MPDKKDQINFVGDSHFDMDNAVFNDTVMEKIRNRKLNLSAVKVFMYIARNRDIKTGRLNNVKVSKIKDYWGLSTRSVRYAIADLIEAGLYEPPTREGVDELNGRLLIKR